MIDKNMLFLQNGSSFLSNAIISGLKQYEFRCEAISFTVNSIASKIDEFDYFFINVDRDTTIGNMAELVYLRDLCASTDKRVFIMGNPDDIQSVTDKLPATAIWDTFERPINSREVAERIENDFDTIDEVVAKKHILVVDDSGTFLHTIKSWLEPKYKISMVNSATSGIAFLATNRPDLILLDYEMPVCNGPRMLEMLRADEDTRDIPVMFLTGKGDRESVQRVLALKPQGYLLKTLPSAKVIQTLDEYFDAQAAAERNPYT